MNSIPRSEWANGVSSELEYWDRWLAGKTPHEAGRRLRFSKDTPVQWWLKTWIPESQTQVRILDVGAGPATTLGKVWPGKTVEIVAVDPLADRYDELLAKHAQVPPVRTLACFGEDVLERFGPASFDVVHACNSLDHSTDPIRCYRQMMGVLKPGGTLVTFHMPTEGESQNYEGLHQWNFAIVEEARGNRIRVWNRHETKDLLECLEDAESPEVMVDSGYIRLRLRKSSPAASCSGSE